MNLIRDTFRRLYPFWRPARADTAAGMALLLVAGLLELLQPWPIKWLVDCVFGSQPAPRWMAWLWHGGGNLATGAAIVCAAILLLALGHKLAQMFSQFLLIRAGLRLVRALRCQVCEHLLDLDLACHDRAKVGDLVYRAAYDTYAAQSLLSQSVAPVATGVVILLGILVVMVRLDWLMTLIALAIVPLFWGLIQSFGRGIAARSKVYHERESAIAAALQENLSSIRAIQAFTREPQVAARVEDLAVASFAANKRLSFAQLGFTLCIGVAMAIGTAAVVYVGARRVLEHRLLLGDVLVFLSYLGMLYTPISAFAQSSGTVRAARTQLDRVFELLDVRPAIADGPTARALPAVRGRVEFRDVTFGYDPARPVLRNVDWTIEPGSTVALVGRTGAGKSTLASLLLRSYDPTTGAVLLDGVDLRDLKLRWLRQQVSVVLQDAILFAGTVAENIAFGSAAASRAQVEDAARRAHADEFIAKLPDGYDTILGERGVNLSGGQRQRLAIARAFVKDAPILVLDEPTSALDAHSESDLVASLEALSAGRTTFIIAHRLSTVRSADLILVLDAGRVIDRGTHEELLARDGPYRELCRKQWGSAAAEAVADTEPLLGQA